MKKEAQWKESGNIATKMLSNSSKNKKIIDGLRYYYIIIKLI